MRLVLDTNVVISGLLWDGAPGRLLDTARTGAAELFTCTELLTEFSACLQRPKFSTRLAAAGVSADQLLYGYRASTTSVKIAPLQFSVSRDPSDDIVLACALAAHADIIVSGDKDLRTLKAFLKIPILAPSDALYLITLPPVP